MRTIYPPQSDGRDPPSCAAAVEPAFAQLLDRAEMAGWSRQAVLLGVCVLICRFAEQGENPSRDQAVELARHRAYDAA